MTNAQYAKFLNDTGVGNDGKSTSTHTALLCESYGSYDWGLHYDTEAKQWVPVSGYENYPVIFVNWDGAN